MKPNKQVLNSLQRYDRKLYMKWNNVDHVWEVWRKMPWGQRLITPLVSTIYGGSEMTFEPLDYRIIDWLYSADSQRRGRPLCWKYKRNKAIKDISTSKWKKFNRNLVNFCTDNYYIVNQDLQKMQTTQMGDTNFKKPEVQSKSSKRIMYRKEYYDGN